MRYVGRFAPSPSGPLHLGSLVTAAASYLDARQNDGDWLVRIEDIDPPREVSGAADAILRALERFALHWDRTVLYQSERLEAYVDTVERLRHQGITYRCSCTRAMLRGLAAEHSRQTPYPGACRNKNNHARTTAIRIRAPIDRIQFEDGLQGVQRCAIDASTGDYVIFRRDGLPAYHLAVVADDAHQRVTHVVRGVDLLESTGPHIHLQRALGHPSPSYCHVPVITDAAGQKLSKQTGATAVPAKGCERLAFDVLRYLGIDPPAELRGAPASELWQWATPRWDASRLQGCRQLGSSRT